MSFVKMSLHQTGLCTQTDLRTQKLCGYLNRRAVEMVVPLSCLYRWTDAVMDRLSYLLKKTVDERHPSLYRTTTYRRSTW